MFLLDSSLISNHYSWRMMECWIDKLICVGAGLGSMINLVFVFVGKGDRVCLIWLVLLVNAVFC